MRGNRQIQFAVRLLRKVPAVHRIVRSMYYRVLGLPVVDYNGINADMLKGNVTVENPTILEAGCNDGTHTLWFLEMFNNPFLYCFEPDPRAARRFKEKVGQRSNVVLLEQGLSGRTGKMTFYQSDGVLDAAQVTSQDDGWDQSGSIKRPKRHVKSYPSISFGRTIEIQTCTIDSWSREYNIQSVDLIWMDVQGAELDVLTGGQETLKVTRLVLAEYSDEKLYEGQCTLRQLIRFMESHGFVVLKRYPRDVLFRKV